MQLYMKANPNPGMSSDEQTLVGLDIAEETIEHYFQKPAGPGLFQTSQC